MTGTPQEKRDAHAKMLSDATEIKTAAETAKRGMSLDEKKRFDELIHDADTLSVEIEKDEMELRGKALASRQAALQKSATVIPSENPRPGENVEVVHFSGTIRGFGEGREARDRAYGVGMWLLGAMNPNHESARRWARNHGMEYRVATEAINTAGGFLVPTTMEQAVINLQQEYGAARRCCQVVNMTSDTHSVPVRSSGQTAYFVGESGTPTASDVAWNLVSLVAKTCAVESRFSSNLSEDAVIDIAGFLSDDCAKTLAKKEDQCWLDGDGTSTYGGMTGIRTKIISGALATYAASLKAAVTAGHDTIPEIDITDITSAMALLPAFAGANPKWYCSNGYYTGAMLRLAAALTGNSLQTYQGGLAKSFLGYPVEICNAMPGSQTTDYTGLAMAFFGDMSQAVMFGSRRGITLTTDPYSLSSYLQTKLVWSERFDIVVHSIGDATTAGPIIALVGGSG